VLLMKDGRSACGLPYKKRSGYLTTQQGTNNSKGLLKIHILFKESIIFNPDHIIIKF